MANELVYSCVFDGSSDHLLRAPIDWLLRQHSSERFRFQPADLTRLREPPRGLAERAAATVSLTECDLLFVHRDAEARPAEERFAEISEALETLDIPRVGIVPMRMTEAWLLFDEPAIRRAAGNPGGRVALGLPPLARMERLPDPKATLHDALRTASEERGRRLAQLDVSVRQHRLADLIDDFAPLRALKAFQRFERDLATELKARGWVNAKSGKSSVD